MEESDKSPTGMRIPRGIPQGGDADAPKSGGGVRCRTLTEVGSD